MNLDLKTPSLLIADDDRGFRETVAELFSARGFQTLLAGDGAEALEILRNQRVHLLLLDMHMPRLSGLDTIERIHVTHGRLPWILMSARIDPQIREAALEAEAASVLSKPVAVDELTCAVSRVLASTYGWKTFGVR